MARNLQRTVTFRVSEQEYQTMVDRHLRAGCHSVSELARLAIERYLRENDGGSQFEARLADLEARFDDLDHCVGLVARELARPSDVTESAVAAEEARALVLKPKSGS